MGKENPNVFYQNPKDVITGVYNTEGLEDEKIWASTELFIATNDAKYFDKNIYQYEAAVPTWSWVPTLGYISILNNQKKVEDFINISRIKRKFKNTSDDLYDIYSKSGYKMTNDYFLLGK